MELNGSHPVFKVSYTPPAAKANRVLGVAVKRDRGWAFVPYLDGLRPRTTTRDAPMAWLDLLPTGYTIDNTSSELMEVAP